MSCCPPAPKTSKIADFSGGETGPCCSKKIRPDEPIECYADRVGNETGLQDDATENVRNTIDKSTIPINRTKNSASVNEKFSLTNGSDKNPASWEYTDPIPGISFEGNELKGTFPESELDKMHKIKVVAKDDAGQAIDTRSFTMYPSKEKDGETLKLISPLPGGFINSKFGMRMHPIHKVEKMHTGIDMVMPNRAVSDVMSAADGEVIYTGFSKSYGNNVKVAHKDSNGKTIAITTYNHLANMYVKPGQKLMAGQKLGREGSTGASTGNHLHFELKTPEGKFLDPAQFMAKPTKIANKTNPDGSADPSSIEEQPAKKTSLTADETAAKDKCPPQSGANAPVDPENPTPQTGMPPSSSEQGLPPTSPKTERDVFDEAWRHTMQAEVGPHWETQDKFSPSDPDVAAGNISTAEQRKKTGYKEWSKSLGGVTKFGISSSTGLPIDVKNLTYDEAKNVGYKNYWKEGGNNSPSKIAEKNPYLGAMLYDIKFQSWGATKPISSKYNLANLPPLSRDEQLNIASQMNQDHLNYLLKDSKNRGHTNIDKGLKNRVDNRLKWLKGLNLG